jgi:phosphohistidine phosphatase SixA
MRKRRKPTHNNPDLTEAGRARADALAQMLQDAGITAIYATEFNRTQQTAAPLAKILRLDVTLVPSKDPATLIRKLRHARGNSLVVGHRTTIPNLITKMGLPSPGRIAENEHDNFFLGVLDKRKPQLIRLHYC